VRAVTSQRDPDLTLSAAEFDGQEWSVRSDQLEDELEIRDVGLGLSLELGGGDCDRIESKERY